MKKISMITLMVLGIISVFFIVLCDMFETNSTSSIGIIGGADGPTSILIYNSSGNYLPIFILIGTIVITIIVFFIVKKKR